MVQIWSNGRFVHKPQKRNSVKYRIVKELLQRQGPDYTPRPVRFFIQASKEDKWMGTTEWNWLTYLDDEGVASRYRFASQMHAEEFVHTRLQDEGIPMYSVVWTQP